MSSKRNLTNMLITRTNTYTSKFLRSCTKNNISVFTISIVMRVHKYLHSNEMCNQKSIFRKKKCFLFVITLKLFFFLFAIIFF